MKLLLRRTRNTLDGVFGMLFTPGLSMLHTMEDDWRDNQPGESCIPSGPYVLNRTVYHKRGYDTFEIMGVPGGRSRCLIHPANTEEDVKGCIGLGLRLDHMPVHDEDDPRHYPRVKLAVMDSKVAFQKFMAFMAHIQVADLEILWATDAGENVVPTAQPKKVSEEHP